MKRGFDSFLQYIDCDAEHWSENQTFPKGAILT